jgi:hypothetical protein
MTNLLLRALFADPTAYRVHGPIAKAANAPVRVEAPVRRRAAARA